ncbi:hypothetical protein DIPPA_24443 [Diplonema papillatum]|nr:hypothetical protein DIPPA_24443 [Diplonema papillatum]
MTSGEVLKKPSAPTCVHNSWDNVRIMKGQVTLRCRDCQSQWRTPADGAWRRSKCLLFNTSRGCSDGVSCAKLHVHPKKQSLTERADNLDTRVLLPLVQPAVARIAEVSPAEISSLVFETKVSCFGRLNTKRSSSSSNDYCPNDICLTSDNGRRGSTSSVVSSCSSVSLLTSRVPRVSYVMPCTHNSWASVRVKKGLVTLRCIECRAQWRQATGSLQKCPDFPYCPKLSSCERTHVLSSKKSHRLQYDQHVAKSQNKAAAAGDTELVNDGISSEAASAACTAEKASECRWYDEELDVPLPAFDDFVQQRLSSGCSSAVSPDIATTDDDLCIRTRAQTPILFTVNEVFPDDDEPLPTLYRCNTCIAQLHF